MYTTHLHENEGRLTRMRATLVRQEALGKIATDLQLSRCLILSTGELKSGGHHRESILADTVEAIIGAIYLDSSDLNLLKDIVLKWYTPYLDHIEPTDQLKDPKSRLQEYLQVKSGGNASAQFHALICDFKRLFLFYGSLQQNTK
ncbi:ribonuclease III domain-containing protein [Pseudomonas aeruginosa]|nr:ribonuclease III domain-containing protein [Pseudomonas aeruginosa]MDO1592078.1 ribonuclease III domain-containing protein [Pseudomonas aeruginosa]